LDGENNIKTTLHIIQMGFIYKIFCNQTGECYYGQSREIKCNRRFNNHTIKSNSTTSSSIIDRGDFQFVIIEDGVDNNMLKEREYYYITNNECVNQTIPWVENDNKSHRHRKEEKDRYYTNQEFYKKKANDYYYTNQLKIQENRSAEIVCECGIEYTKGNKLRHLKSKFHLNKILPNSI
jgi:signal peptidase I